MRRKLSLAVFGLSVLLLVSVLLFEPFAKRFEGKTQRQWLRSFAEARDVDPRIVEALGTNAVSFLVGTIHRGLTLKKARGLVREALNISGTGDEQNPEMLAAGAWLSWLAAKNYRVADPRLPRISFWMDCYDDQFFAPRYVQLWITTPTEAATELAKVTAHSREQ